MSEAMLIYFGIGAVIGAGMAILFASENSHYPLSARFLAALTVWTVVVVIWPLTLTILVLNKLLR